jgi:hypothetical protein
MTPLAKAPGEQFEISVDGTPRNYRDRTVKSEPGKGSVFTMRLLAGADT